MSEHHEALNPIHPSVLSSLAPAFIKLYNEHVANIPNKPIDLNFLRSKYSVLYSYGTAPAPEAARTWDTKIPGHQGAEISVRMYEPADPGPWPVHIDFHGGGKIPAPTVISSNRMLISNSMGTWRPRHRIPHLQAHRIPCQRRRHRRGIPTRSRKSLPNRDPRLLRRPKIHNVALRGRTVQHQPNEDVYWRSLSRREYCADIGAFGSRCRYTITVSGCRNTDYR